MVRRWARACVRGWSLRSRILVTLCLLLAAVGTIGHLVTSSLLARSAAVFEARDAAARFDRMLLGVTQSVGAMVTVVSDNAVWDDTFAHLQRFDAKYISTNFTPAAMHNLDVDQVVFIAASGKFHSALDVSMDDVRPLGADSRLVQEVQRSLAALPDAAKQGKGYMLRWVGSAPVAMAFSAVRRSDAGPQVAGWMVMVRDLTQAAGSLEKAVGIKPVFAIDDVALQYERAMRLPDSVGDSTVYLKAALAPVLQAQSALGNTLSIVNNVALVVIAIVLSVSLLEVLVLRRLTLFANLARGSRAQEGGKPVEWPVAGSDELDELAMSLNAMVQERRIGELKLRQEARTDALTGLGNRRNLLESMEQVFAMLRRGQEMDITLLLLDLDGFKHINDSLGHEVGDAMLVWVSRQIELTIRDTDLPVRLGGDEFAIFSFMPKGQQDAEVFATRVLAAVCQPFAYKGQDLTVSASMGVVTPQATESVELAIRNADIAMYAAKDLGKNRYQVFTDTMHAHVMGRMELEQSLRRAIEEQSFEIWFQPIVDAASGKAVMVEALARLRINGKFCPPDRFIALAEEAGLIGAIGQQLAQKAFSGLARLHRHHPGLVLNLNLSAHQLMDPSLLAFLTSTLKHCGVAVQYVHLELTETAVAQDDKVLHQRLEQLADAGFHLHLDDFGTGQSSLHRVQQLPFGSLKLDKSFVDLLLKGVETIPRIMLSLAKDLNMRVIAEGVETREQVVMLQGMGYSLMQGYVFAKPMPEDQLLLWLQDAA